MKKPRRKKRSVNKKNGKNSKQKQTRSKHKNNKHKSKIGPVLVVVGLIALLISVSYQDFYLQEEIATNGEGDAIIVPENDFYHVHADFAVYINGKKTDFNSSIYSERDPRIHLHIRNQYGDSVIHVEAEDAIFGEFFTSIGMRIKENCFRTRSMNFCNDGNRTLKMYVNGIKNDDFENYEIKDLDRILITFGNEKEEEIKKQMNSVTKASCIFSDKCITPQDMELRL